MGLDSSADLLFRIGADPSEGTAALDLFRSVVARDLAGVRGEFQHLASDIAGPMSTMKAGLLGLAAGAAAAAAGLAAAFVGAAGKMAAYAEQIEEGTHKTGLSAEQMSALAYAAKSADLPLDQLTRGLTFFASTIWKAQDATSVQAQAFHSMGISQKDVIAASKDMYPLLMKVANAFHENAYGVQKSALARELWLRGGPAFVEMVSRGSEGIKVFTDRAKDLGVVLTEKDLVAVKAYNLALIELKARQDALNLSMGKAALPTLTGWTIDKISIFQTLSKALTAPKFGGLAAFWTDWIQGVPKVAEQVKKELAAALAGAGTKGFIPPEAKKEAKEAATDFWGLTGVLDQVRTKMAGLGTEEEQIAAYTAHMNFEVRKASEAFMQLLKPGKLDPETLKRETEAMYALPDAIRKAQAAAELDLEKKRRQEVAAAETELQKMLAAQGEEGFAKQRALWAEEIAKLRENLEQNKTMKVDARQNLMALLAAVDEAGQRKIIRQEGEAFRQELVTLQGYLAEMVTARMTAAERIGWTYDQDLVRYSEMKEAEALRGKEGADAEVTRQQFEINRTMALKRYQTDLQALRNSQGWQGVFGEQFARGLRGNEELLREWTYSSNQALLMVKVAAETLRETLQQSFGVFAQAMGQNIAQAVIYQKSIGAALRAAAAAAIESIAAQSLVHAIYSAGLGFLRLAQYDYAAAAAAFKAAALFGTVGAVAAVTGRAVAGRQEAATTGAGTAAGARSGGTAGGGATAAEKAAGPRISIIINGHVIGQSGIEELTQMINEAVQGRDVRLVATVVKQETRLVR